MFGYYFKNISCFEKQGKYQSSVLNKIKENKEKHVCKLVSNFRPIVFSFLRNLILKILNFILNRKMKKMAFSV